MSIKAIEWAFRQKLSDPTAKLVDHAAHIYLAHGVTISVATICRAMARLRMTKKKLQHYGCSFPQA